MSDFQTFQFIKAGCFILAGIIFILAGMLTSKLISPNNPNSLKLSNYECGEESIGSAWTHSNIRFYTMGLIFLIFDVEIFLLFPYSVVFADKEIIRSIPQWGLLAAIEGFIFIGILLVGFVYIVLKRDIDWMRPKPFVSDVKGSVPNELYQQFNENQTNENGITCYSKF